MSMNGQGIRDLLGREIKINRGGPDSVQGTLTDVRWDYMAMNCKEGIVYVNESHVKSITDTGRSGGNRNAAMGNPIPSNTFLGVMQALRFRRVQINRGGPEKVEGILADANQNQLIMTLKNQEIVRIPMQHVKSVSLVRGGGNNNNNNNSNTSQGNQAVQGNQAAQGNQSRGNRSQGNQAQGNKSGGNKSRSNQGNRSQGQRVQGNQSQGNKSGGNKSRGNQGCQSCQGNQSRGNKSGGKKK
ncbi:hypothetical protein QVE09_18940 [Paenibacillus sp. ClWae2A]|uniref:hypothetical protein n=1 Tax=Paenibacillus sp. ClWae2A TaxID=3057177 RepID=UPI0028F63E8D|nr:hypothetical protein [Paenibacillus sp. ClWae2A]MDT9720981.1 hypothetical protein [Paenibacillus sp. ClWae2A]